MVRRSRQRVSISLGSASFDYSSQTAKGESGTVSEQSGIHTGKGGFDLKVDGSTDLKGGVISSTAPEDKNKLETGTLSWSDIETGSQWETKTSGFGGMIGTGASGAAGSGPLFEPTLKDGDKDSGSAKSAISLGQITITNPEGQNQDITELNRDTTNTNDEIKALPDLQAKLNEQLKTQQEWTQAAANMATAVKDAADFMRDKVAQDKKQKELWDEGGAARAALHAIAGGLLGGVNGVDAAIKSAIAAGVSTLIAPYINDIVKEAVAQSGLTGEDAKRMSDTLTSSIVLGLLAGAGGSDAAAYASNEIKYNYLTEDQLKKYKEALAKCDTSADYKSCAQEVWFGGGFYEIYNSNRDGFENCIATNDYACIDQHVNEILAARDSARELRQDMIERMPGNRVSEPNNYALDIIRSYYYGFDPDEVAVYRDVYCGGATSSDCRASLKNIADQRNSDALKKGSLFVLLASVGAAITVEGAAACLASQVCTSAFAMADAAITLQACADGDAVSCGSLKFGKGRNEADAGKYLEDFKPSKTPAELVQQQAGKPTEVTINTKHILSGEIKTYKDGTKVGTGGHYLRDPNVRVTKLTQAADVNGVTRGYIAVRDPATGKWYEKKSETTFFSKLLV